MQRARNLTDYAIVLNQNDNVATALKDIPRGDYALISSGNETIIAVSQDIKAGFKVAISPIQTGDRVVKYGHAIGAATVPIRPGDCVHMHNMTSCYSPQGRAHT
jgi:altronate dehydratase small subunit